MYRRLTSVLLLIAVAVILCFSSTAYAEQGLAALPQDVDESALREDLVEFLNSTYSEELGRQTIVADDIDLSLTVKLYNGPELFSGDVSDFATVKEQLDNERYMMLIIQMYFGGDTYQAEVVKGEPVDYSKLSEQTLANPDRLALLESRVGKWYVQTVGYGEGIQPDYMKVAAERTGIYDREPILVKGLPHFHYPVAIYPDDEGNLGTMTVIHPATAPWEVLGIKKPGEDAEFVFDFEFIKEQVNSLPPEGGGTNIASSDTSEETATSPSPPPGSDQEDTSEQPLPILPLAIAAVAVVAVVVAIIVIRRRQIARRQSTESETTNDQ
jgi:hypothetical protein